MSDRGIYSLKINQFCLLFSEATIVKRGDFSLNYSSIHKLKWARSSFNSGKPKGQSGQVTLVPGACGRPCSAGWSREASWSWLGAGCAGPRTAQEASKGGNAQHEVWRLGCTSLSYSDKVKQVYVELRGKWGQGRSGHRCSPAAHEVGVSGVGPARAGARFIRDSGKTDVSAPGSESGEPLRTLRRRKEPASGLRLGAQRSSLRGPPRVCRG